MNKIDTSRLMKTRADELFPDLLTSQEMQEIHDRRMKKAIKLGSVTTKNFKEIREDEYIIKGGGYEKSESDVLITSDDFDIHKYMNDMEDETTGTLHDLKIDTRDLPLAKNYYDFAFNLVGKKANPPWSRQLWITSMLMAEICPCCSNKKWMVFENVPKDYSSKNLKEHLIFLEYGKCPKCKRNKWELIQNHGLKNYMQIAMVLGQRSGKSSWLATQAAPYLLHRMLKFPSYASLTKGMQSSTQLTGTFVSLNFNKALGNLWTPFRRCILEENDWFIELQKLLDYYKQRYGKELYKISGIYTAFHYKNIKLYPSGPTSNTLRGDTRFLGGLDELGLFPLPKGNEEEQSGERANADEAHRSLFSSLGTINALYNSALKRGYFTAPPALMMSVSSPYSIRDKMMRLLREARTPEGTFTILGVNCPTWEINPIMERDTPIIASAFISNPEKANRDWGAIAPTVHSRFMNPEAFKEKIFVGGQNSHNFIYQFDSPGEVYGKVERIRSFRWPSIIAIDAGHTNNSFFIGGGHYDFNDGKTKVTTLLECIPQEGRKINFNLLYNFAILQIAKDLNAVGLVADQWQSIDLLYRIKQDMGNNPLQKIRCLPKQYSPKRKDFNTAVAMITSGNVIFPNINDGTKQRILDGNIDDWRTEMTGNPVEHLFLQMCTVKNVGELRCPEKGDGFTDDGFRTVVLLISTIHQPKVMERLVEAKEFNYGFSGNKTRMPTPALLGRSGRPFTGLR